MKKFYTALISVFFILNFISFAEASCGSSNCSLISGSQDGVTGEGRFVVDLSFRYIPQDDKKSGSSDTDEVLVPKIDFENMEIEPEHHREIKTINKIAQFDVSYGVTDELTVTLNIPFFNDRYHEHFDGVELPNEPGEFTNTHGTTGFGDVTLSAKYAVYRTIKHLLIAGAGVKFPTGEYRLRIEGENPGEAEINEPTIMPGTGSYDFIISGLYNFAVIPNRLNLFASVSHRFTTENSLNYHIGDNTFLDGGVSYLLMDKVNLSLQINARISGRDEFVDMNVPSTGGEFVNLTPGVRLIATENMSIYSHVQIPIYQRVNEVNLVASYGFLLGASYGF